MVRRQKSRHDRKALTWRANGTSVSSVGGVPADLQKAGTGGNVDRDYGGVVRTPENWMI